LIGDFIPEAVLTVAHGTLWISAAEFAGKRRLPLHLLVHDDWPTVTPVPGALRSTLNQHFGRRFRQAASRLCVSPFMRDVYRERYGVEGNVLYPCRASDAVSFDQPPMRRAGVTQITVAYAGTINSGGYAELLRLVASALQKLNGTLLIFGPHTANSLTAWRLNKPNIKFAGMVPSNTLIDRLRTDADILLVPMAFDGAGDGNMQLSFPSKLTDYSATGLPLFILGPQSCSAARWAQANGPVAEIVTEPNEDIILAALRRLSDGDYRLQLGCRCMRAGKSVFDHAAIQALFFDCLAHRCVRTNAPTVGTAG
jgi:glycosyltransferase involved in cell wall biosynthesis